MKAKFITMAMVAIVGLSACKKDPPVNLDENVQEDAPNEGPIPGKIDVIGDWETGDFSQWNGGLSAKDPAAQIKIVTDPVRASKYATRFIVRPGDKVKKPNGEVTSGERAEVGLWNYKREQLNDEYYYGWSTLFPTDWTAPARWGIFMQWHAHTSISPPLALNARDNQVVLDFYTGNIANFPAKVEYNEKPVILTKINKGKWNDFIVRIKFRPDYTGIVEVWHRLEGETLFKKVLSLKDIPTLQWTANAGDIEDKIYEVPFTKDGKAGYTTGCYVKHGLYRGDDNKTNTIYQDNWCRGTSFASVRSRFNF